MATSKNGADAASIAWRQHALADDATPRSLGCSGVAAALLATDSPSPDAWFLCEGLDAASMRAWTDSGSRQDKVLRAAHKTGWCAAKATDTGLSLKGRQPKGGAHALWVSSPESIDGGLRWCAVFLRGGAPFTPEERDILVATVRLWQARFNHPEETGLSQMLVGEDERVIHADPACALRLLRAGVEPGAFVHELFEIVEQRWETLAPGGAYDVAIPFDGDALWATVRPRAAAYSGASPQTLIEIRPIEEGELPALGLIEDARVARTLGYLHDHYNDGPRLNELAEQAGVSAFHFHRVFAKAVGVSPKQYQLLKQLQVARWRLRCGREPIGQIADRVGFSNHAHFTATFRRMLERSPSEYRASSY